MQTVEILVKHFYHLRLFFYIVTHCDASLFLKEKFRFAYKINCIIATCHYGLTFQEKVSLMQIFEFYVPRTNDGLGTNALNHI